MTQKLKVYIVQNFADKGTPYYGFNYVEKPGTTTNAIRIHKDHPIFQEVEAPRPRRWWNQQKYIITADLSPKTKTEYGIKYYFYDPEIEIENIKRVDQCLSCQDDANKKYNYEDCNCSCSSVNDDCFCYQIQIPPK